MPFTKRHAILQEFSPDEAEDRLYNLVTAYLQRDNLQALPSGQRALMTLVLRKLLASSSFAIAGALASISERLGQAGSTRAGVQHALTDAVEEDYEALDETEEEWADEDHVEPLTEADLRALETEIAELRDFAALATSIEQNAKGPSVAHRAASRLRQSPRVRSGRKGDHLYGVAAHSEPICCGSSRTVRSPIASSFSTASNTDDQSRAIYEEWSSAPRWLRPCTGSRTADMRSALIDYFRDSGKIMIATEAGAEGINLQFCSMVVNYDLPWNPQRIEQRIGRCHRYGQKYDVVVVNFLNRKQRS